MKTQVMSIKDFMNYEKEPFSVKVERHFKKYGKVYKVAGLTLIILGTGSTVFASSPIDVEAGKLYRQLVGIGKWIVVFKAGIDILKSLGNGEVDAAKKCFFSSLLVYLLLLGLPFGLDKVDQVFNNIHK